MKTSKQKLSPKIAEKAKRGDVGEICYYLNQAYEKDLTSSKKSMKVLLKTLTENRQDIVKLQINFMMQ